MPSTEKNIVLKLDNGYNVGLFEKHIKNIQVLEKKKAKTPEKKQVKQNTKLPKITILHMGGTIASKVDYATGGVSAQFDPAELLALFPELKELAQINSILLANMLSENMQYAHYNLIAKAVEKEVKKGVDGIIITHGTDTLHYTGAALAFALEHIGIPVLLVGSQRSSDRGSSDAASNLLAAVVYATVSKQPGVALCMHATENDDYCFILDPLKARKFHTSRRDAFRPVNTKPIATVDPQKKEVRLLKAVNKKTKDSLKVHTFNEKINIGMLYMHPGFPLSLLESAKKLDGLILLGTGLGHAPIQVLDEHTKQNEKIFKTLAELAATIPVVMTSQCMYGMVNLQVYTAGRLLQEKNIWGSSLDMTPETALIKLAFVMQNYPKKEWQQRFHENLRGECAGRIEKDTFLY